MKKIIFASFILIACGSPAVHNVHSKLEKAKKSTELSEQYSMLWFEINKDWIRKGEEDTFDLWLKDDPFRAENYIDSISSKNSAGNTDKNPK